MIKNKEALLNIFYLKEEDKKMGKLFVIDGTDGSGKQTQFDLLKEHLKRIEKRIYNAAEKSSDVKNFLNTLNSNGGYYWRIIANTNRKSFHSLGIALDLQPKSYGWKEVYWSWAKDKNPDGWMLTPLKDRWMPPQEVIDIFEEEGFIWGGKWGIWDNMHFEYHPELINMAKYKENEK